MVNFENAGQKSLSNNDRRKLRLRAGLCVNTGKLSGFVFSIGLVVVKTVAMPEDNAQHTNNAINCEFFLGNSDCKPLSVCGCRMHNNDS